MKFLASLLLVLGFSGVFAAAQTAKPTETPPAEKQNSKTPTSKAPAKKPPMTVPKTTKDLDAFFKEGEAQAKDGPRCERSPAPVA